MKKRVKEGSALVLAVLLAFATLALPKVQAAIAVDTTALCSIDFSIAGDFEELNSVQGGVPIKLYKVADVDASGKFTAVSPFESVDVSYLEKSDTAAAAWQERADSAAKLITGAMTPNYEETTSNGAVKIENIAVGLYLVAADNVQSDYYTYSFKPYLVSLPNNYYSAANPDDSWIYDLEEVSLKPEQEARYGKLRINKTLENQNVTMGEEATFVFQVDITTPKGEKSSKQVALTFETTADKMAQLDQIPAGSTVVVTEIYSGASYTLTSEAQQEALIVADESADVTFSNAHDGRPNGGYGIVNHYTLNEDGQYEWEQLPDHSMEQN